jgi:hypothetical protein
LHLPWEGIEALPTVLGIEFVGHHITDLWSADEWMTFNDARVGRRRR